MGLKNLSKEMGLSAGQVISDATRSNTSATPFLAAMTSDDDFDDDDDDILKALVAAETQNASALHKKLNSLPHSENSAGDAGPSLQNRLYKAEGEVSILRAQLQQLQNTSRDEVARLRESLALEKHNKDGQVELLRAAVQLLEDERKFLNNELRATSVALKRRKVSESQTANMAFSGAIGANSALATPSTQLKSPKVSDPKHSIAGSGQYREDPRGESSPRPLVPQKVIKIDNDASLLEDHLWNHCINGSKRTTVSYLSKVYLNREVRIRDFVLHKKQPISTAVTEFLMTKKALRLDSLIHEFSITMCELVEDVIAHQIITSVPFLLSLVYACLIFRSSALNKETIRLLVPKICLIAINFAFLLDSSQDQDDIINYHNVALQVMVLQKFSLICCFDIMERIVYVATVFDTEFSTSLWQEPQMVQLFKLCLPEISERFMNTTQINLVYSVVEMLISSITELGFAFDNQAVKNDAIVSSLLKVFLIDIPIKEDFKFYGLNRLLGNNSDLAKVEATVPELETFLQESMVLIPCPIPQTLHQELAVTVETNHELHLLYLRLRVATMIEGHIVTKGSTQLFQNNEYLKSIVRYIGLEQGLIMNSPRAPTVHIRVRIISTLVRVLHHIATEAKTITNVVYPETMYEVFVILLRIAFGSDSLSVDAYQLLSHARQMNYTGTIYNYWCEQRARQLGHSDGVEDMADVESEFANGLEFPYEPEIIELAREILEPCVTHEEADNLYFNMNYEEPRFDEMDLVM